MIEVTAKSRRRTAELVTHIKDACIQMLGERFGVAKDEAEAIAREFAHRALAPMGGAEVYVPQDLEFLLSKRDIELWNEFNGNNHLELAKKYKVSEVWVYKIIARVKAEEIAKRQGQLPGVE